MKTFLAYLKEKGFESQADFDLKDSKEKEGHIMGYNAYLRQAQTEALNDKATKQDLELAKEELVGEAVKTESSISELKTALHEQGTALAKLLEGGISPSEAKASLQESIAAHHKDIVEIANGKKENLYIPVKGLDQNQIGGSITKANTVNASVVNNEVSEYLNDIGQLATRRTTALNLLPFLSIPRDKNGQVGYLDWDEATKVRAADMRAEGITFPESTAAYQYYTLPMKKVADNIPYSDEFEYDNTTLTNELQSFLVRNVELKADSQIVVGDNVGANLRGMETSINAYVPVASGITDASIYDLIVKLRESIETDGGNKYRTDIAFMNIADINKMKLKKDGRNNYILPPFADTNGNMVDGVTVIENNAVVANTMYIGDRAFARVYGEPGFVIERGYAGTDFIDGIKRLKVYRRLLFLIREADKSGFLKVPDIDAALATLAL